jgi:tellurite resistance protein
VPARLDASSRTGRRSRRPAAGLLPRLHTDDAFIALLIAAMDASGHVSAEEAARAHHIIWSMRRFRRRSGETVGRTIERVRTLIERHGSSRIVEEAAPKSPSRLRGAAFAVATDLVLVDGRLERAERRFLEGVAAHLRLTPLTARRILDVIRIKNSV